MSFEEGEEKALSPFPYMQARKSTPSSTLFIIPLHFLFEKQALGKGALSCGHGNRKWNPKMSPYRSAK